MEVGLQLVIVALEKASVAIYKSIADHVGPKHVSISELDEEHRSKKSKVNISGDTVLALDDIADRFVEECLRNCSVVAGFASEEREGYVSGFKRVLFCFNVVTGGNQSER